MQDERETISWKRTLDGIYHATLPKFVGVHNLVTMWSQIFNDYAEHFVGAGPLLVLIDGHSVEYFDEKALSIASLHVIPRNTDANIAIHSRSPTYKKAADLFSITHPIPENMKYFENEQLARHWLSDALSAYNKKRGQN